MNKKIIASFLILTTITFLVYKFILPNNFSDRIAINSNTNEGQSPTLSNEIDLSKVTILIFKKEQQLEIWGEHNDSLSIFYTLPLQNINSEIGPKLYQNDGQFPEGIYTLSSSDTLPFSESLSFIFPNDFDVTKAKADNRTALDTIFFPITFTPSAPNLKTINNFLQQVNTDKIQVLIVPNDARKMTDFNACMDCPFWIAELYGNLKLHLNQFSTPIVVQ